MIAQRFLTAILLLTLSTQVCAAAAPAANTQAMDVNTSAAYLNALQLRDRRTRDLEKALETSANNETVEFIQAQINELEKQIAHYEALGLKPTHHKKRKRGSLGLKIALGTAVAAGTVVLAASIYDAKNNTATWPSGTTLSNNWSKICEVTHGLFHKQQAASSTDTAAVNSAATAAAAAATNAPANAAPAVEVSTQTVAPQDAQCVAPQVDISEEMLAAAAAATVAAAISPSSPAQAPSIDAAPSTPQLRRSARVRVQKIKKA